jgi:hypothetical protein
MFNGYLRKQDVIDTLKRYVNSFPYGTLERDIWNDACRAVEDISPTWGHWVVYGRASSGDSMWEKSYRCSECKEDPSFSDYNDFCSCCGKPMNGIVTYEPCEYFTRKLGVAMCKHSSEETECYCNGDVDNCEIGRRNRAAYRR